MSAYIFVSVEIHDPVRYEDYRKSVLPTIEKYGGRFLARGGKMEVLEGNWPARRIVIVEFPSAEIALSLAMSEGAVKVAVHRLRQRYRQLLREEIAQTVATPAEIDEELRNLFRAVSGKRA